MGRKLTVRVGSIPILGLQRGTVDGASLSDLLDVGMSAVRSSSDAVGMTDNAAVILSTPGAGLGQTSLGTSPLGA